MKNNLPSNFLSSLTNGSLSVKWDNKPAVSFSCNNSSKIIDIVDIPIKISRKPGIIKQLSEAKDLAKKLKHEGITLEIKLKGDTVLKLGKEANPKLAKIVTLSNDIEIKDLKKLKKITNVF
ncbi:hypothetical protein [Nitrosopumilus piranensis]|uniref:Uncharacterized protein n=1 Tax=Nitrosopumilus piranensis TaxID=1582439 RepID=A0A0C5BRM6_9ARCH|nr:hypothetical protein [Nitrosopumilus piranensis]AJM92398.1 hypothetical protein NPIRD3C_1186 [Nitrosopumilus piranensis]